MIKIVMTTRNVSVDNVNLVALLMIIVNLVSNAFMGHVQNHASLAKIVKKVIIVTLIIKSVTKDVQLIPTVLEDTHVLRVNVPYTVV